MNESLFKAAEMAGLLTRDLRAAHSDACTENPLLEILLLDLIAKAAEIEQQVKRINLALQ